MELPQPRLTDSVAETVRQPPPSRTGGTRLRVFRDVRQGDSRSARVGVHVDAAQRRLARPLRSDAPSERSVLRLIHLPHAALTEPPQDAMVSQRCPDEFRRLGQGRLVAAAWGPGAAYWPRKSTVSRMTSFMGSGQCAASNTRSLLFASGVPNARNSAS